MIGNVSKHRKDSIHYRIRLFYQAITGAVWREPFTYGGWKAIFCCRFMRRKWGGWI